ncbi:MAG: hypothetical protein F2813_01885 [Actinobacteria bacterium]|uniref:Unannotated protein n=1 Tax=freshwater metagenome TaxID=449393 RepID=A0A6J5ZCN8_9ZZZZ|nr:hypothetical protein [Actinomycetota bacterium]
MHNVNVEAIEATAANAAADPAAGIQPVALTGEWNVEEGAVQFTTQIPLPSGGTVAFSADFPPPMGGTGAAPSPLAYCFWGGLACYAMTFAQEAAREGIELSSLRGRVAAELDMARALGIGDQPPLEEINWTLEVSTEADDGAVERLRQIADARCPGAWCLRNALTVNTAVERS